MASSVVSVPSASLVRAEAEPAVSSKSVIERAPTLDRNCDPHMEQYGDMTCGARKQNRARLRVQFHS
jgi:hypothetical protein